MTQLSNKLFVCTHGEFGKEILQSAKMIVGEMEDVKYFSLKPGMVPTDYRKEIEDYLNENTEDNYLCLVDLFGGTPCNMVTSLNKENLEIISGLNLAMLIETYSLMQTVSISELKEIAFTTLANSGVDVKKRFKELRESKG